MKKRTAKKRLVFGKDWNAWAWKNECDCLQCAPMGFGHSIILQEWKPVGIKTANGRWVQVKIIEVKHK